jgi:hypothetical protein
MAYKRFVKNGGVCAATAGIVKLALAQGYDQHAIAGYFGDNQGRVSETKNGKRYADVPIAPQLPVDFPALT